MKKHLLTTILILTLLLGGVALFPHKAEAGWIETLACIMGSGESCPAAVASADFVNNILADIGNSVLAVCGWILTASGVVLNMAVILTMNIKAIYQATPAIEQVWVVIRNLSSIFIIFALVYVSVRKILDVDSPSLGTMIKNIVIAGLLINFSLFFTRVAIDTSNLISMQFYRAIAPKFQNVNIADKSGLTGLLGASFTSGGLSNVFMQSLKISKIYNVSDKKIFDASTEGGRAFKTVIQTFAGSALMIIAALSFFAAAIAFIVRLVILLLLMGFSPVFFVGMIFPDIQKNISGKWMGYLEQQLIFMPVYLLFMYVAIRFINGATPGEGFFAALDASTTNAGKAAEHGVLLSTVGLMFQYTIAIILINIPLIAALQTGGMSVKWGAAAKDWVGGKMKGGLGFGTQHLVGRGAKAAAGVLASSGLATRNPNTAILLNKGLSSISGASFGGSKGGYDKRFKEYTKERQEYAKKIKTPEAMQQAYVASKIGEWDGKMASERARIARELAEVKKRKEGYERILRTGSPEQKEIALQKLNETQEEEKKLTAQLGKNTKEDRDKEMARLKKEGENARAAQYAESLGGSANPFSNKADKEAAKDILKGLSKGKKDKALDAFRELFEEAEGGAGKGGDAKKPDKE